MQCCKLSGQCRDVQFVITVRQSYVCKRGLRLYIVTEYTWGFAMSSLNIRRFELLRAVAMKTLLLCDMACGSGYVRSGKAQCLSTRRHDITSQKIVNVTVSELEAKATY